MLRVLGFAAVLLVVSVAWGQEADWYPFVATGNPAAGEIGLQDWNEHPAGKSGRIVRKDEVLTVGGKPIKLWGVNLCYGACLPDKETADKRAAFYAKYGINAVRLHKFTESEYTSADSIADYVPAAIDRMDYQVAKLKEAGIYFDLSVQFGNPRILPGDRKYIPYIDELGKFVQRGNKVQPLNLEASTVYYSPELQNLHIQQMLNLLKHKNPYTGMTYAQDPAIGFLEIVNEQSVLFYSSMNPLKKYPVIRKIAEAKFCEFLTKKYTDDAGLLKAWGEKAMNIQDRDWFTEQGGESLAQKNIVPLGNPWFWDPDQINGSQSWRRQRLLDTLEFLSGLQSDFYARYAKAVREAGYTGEIIGSNWQAGRAESHLANLYSDYLTGMIDRHNYYGGGGGRGRPFENGSMLRTPGSDLLSTGMQQVIDRPFSLSEWNECYPNEWGAEAPAIIGAYGLGLQGWDASFMFQNDDRGNFSDHIGRSPWDPTAPNVLGVFPAVARAIHRGDVTESPVTAVRNVHMPSLFEGKLGFDDKVKQTGDVKEMDTDKVPAASLAAVRTVIAFSDTYQETPALDMTPYQKDGFIVSSTGQLRWMPGKDKTDGFFSMDTPATQGVVGFASGKDIALKDAHITLDSRFAAIYLTAQGKTETLATAKKVLIIAMARARNTGMTFNEAENTVTAAGKAPILLEGVKARIELLRKPAKVMVLDQDGLPTNKQVQVKDGTFTIDTAHDQSPYYVIEY